MGGGGDCNAFSTTTPKRERERERCGEGEREWGGVKRVEGGGGETSMHSRQPHRSHNSCQNGLYFVNEISFVKQHWI